MSHMYPSGAPAGFEDQSHIGEPNEPEQCSHDPDGWEFDDKHHAFLISTCEHCGQQLIATEIDDELLKATGELSVEEYEEDPQ